MQVEHSKEWFCTPAGDPRGYVDPHVLEEVWFHTGTVCNLSCMFCLEGAGPGDGRVETLAFDDAVPFIDEAIRCGAERLSFTGGEPFMVPDFIRILSYAAEKAPCLVLTNGTDPIQRHWEALETLVSSTHPVRFRISLDYPDAAKHNAVRGEGRFEQAVGTLAKLHKMGFGVSVARHMDKDEDRAATEAAYVNIFRKVGLPENTALIPFADFGTPNTSRNVPDISTDCMTRYQTEETRKKFMCAFSKMVVKQNGEMRVYPCTLVDDDTEYAMGSTLTEALEERVSLKHHRCFNCFAFGSSCSEG